MKYSVNVKGRTPYQVIIERGLIHSVASFVPAHEKIVILTDEGVPVQWVDSVKDQFDDALLISIPRRRIEIVIPIRKNYDHNA